MKERRRRWCLACGLVWGIWLTGCGRPTPIAETRQEIYGHVLADFQGRRTPVVVCGQTRLHEFLMFSTELKYEPGDKRWRLAPEAERLITERLPELDASTLESFKAANVGPGKVQLDVAVPGVRVAEAPCAQEMENYPDLQFVEVSDVGVGHKGRQALVYLGVLDGDIGRGWLILLERTNEGWAESGTVGVWVA